MKEKPIKLTRNNFEPEIIQRSQAQQSYVNKEPVIKGTINKYNRMVMHVSKKAMMVMKVPEDSSSSSFQIVNNKKVPEDTNLYFIPCGASDSGASKLNISKKNGKTSSGRFHTTNMLGEIRGIDPEQLKTDGIIWMVKAAEYQGSEIYVAELVETAETTVATKKPEKTEKVKKKRGRKPKVVEPEDTDIYDSPRKVPQLPSRTMNIGEVHMWMQGLSPEEMVAYLESKGYMKFEDFHSKHVSGRTKKLGDFRLSIYNEIEGFFQGQIYTYDEDAGMIQATCDLSGIKRWEVGLIWVSPGMEGS